MPKVSTSWYSERVERDVDVVRWGTYGTPVLVFPTAGGDAEEIERFHLVDACAELLDAGRVKLYSVDSVNGRVLLAGEGDSRPPGVDPAPVLRVHPPRGRAGDPHRLRQRGHRDRRRRLVDRRVQRPGVRVPASRTCSAAVCMSGTYDLRRFYDGPVGEDFVMSSPLRLPARLDGEHLDRLRPRFVVLASGEGANEDIGESWRMSPHVLGTKGIPNRVDSWGRSGSTTGRCGGRCCPATSDELV